jgi:hypothetical protein
MRRTGTIGTTEVVMTATTVIAMGHTITAGTIETTGIAITTKTRGLHISAVIRKVCARGCRMPAAVMATDAIMVETETMADTATATAIAAAITQRGDKLIRMGFREVIETV